MFKHGGRLSPQILQGCTCATPIRMRCPVHIALVSGGVLAAVLALVTRWRKSHNVVSKAAAALPSDAPASAAPVVRVPLGELPPLKNDLLLRAARREAIERVPIWIMRQAGRLGFCCCNVLLGAHSSHESDSRE